MGWTSYPTYGKVNRRHECDRVYSGETDAARWEVLKSAMVGSTYYAAVKRTDKATGASKVFAGVCLTHIEKGEFYYKDMDESMHPYQYKCPNSILDLLTETEYEPAKEWRRICREHNARPNLGLLPIGAVIEFELQMPEGKRTFRATKRIPMYQFKTPWWEVDGGYIKKKNIPENFRVIK